MLFNKDNNGTAEIKQHVGFVYAANNFDNIKTDVILAEESMVDLVGEDVYNLADEFYNGTYVEESASGSGSASASGRTELLTELVSRLQLPIALFAIHSFQLNSDVSHEDSGRKVKIDSDNEKLPWEWMLDKDSDATLSKAHRTTDRLISFLDKHEDSFPEWKNSDSQQLQRSLFINTAKDFNSIYPIDNSRMFFLHIAPFIADVENRFIKPVIGVDEFNSMKENLKTKGLDSDQEEILTFIKPALAQLTMSIAIIRLSVKILPSGVVQQFVSNSQSRKASSIPQLEIIRQVAAQLELSGRQDLTALQELLTKQVDEDAYIDEDDEVVIDSTKKYVSV